ncbi:MAG: DUF3800 domain-containing protein, partial [Fibrobacteres bacterium]|nr:DUF3800 domain-containing protein [Fibrobacterota bacterium]
STDVRKYRGTLSEEEAKRIIETKPDYPVYTVFADESGKTDKYLIVGSVWALDNKMLTAVTRQYYEWKNKNNITHEFHFKEIDKKNINDYLKFVQFFLGKAAAFSFKVIMVPRAGLANQQDAFTKLYYYLLKSGISHENSSGRAPLPRSLQLYKDQEEEGYDRLLLAQIKDNITKLSALEYNNILVVDELEAIDSKSSHLIQIADLYAGSRNRIYNYEVNTENPKCEFAKYFLGALNTQQAFKKTVDIEDMSVFLSL